MIHKKNILKRILYISLLTLLILTTQKLYAQYILTRNFEVNLSTAPFDVEITGTSKDVYDIDVDKLSATVKNNNSYPISGNVTFNNKQVTTFEIPAGGTKALSNLTLTKVMVSGLTAGQYDLVVNVTAPYATNNNSIKVNLKGTFTNVEKCQMNETGLGTTANPYLVYKIEDLVRFGKQVENGKTYAGLVVKQDADLDFANSNPKSYYNANDTSFLDLNGNANDGNKILTEMTTGTGFTGIGTWGVSTYKAFKGTYDGNNKAIRSVAINSNRAIGLFNTIEGATIKNLRASGAIKTTGDAGSIVGWVQGKNNKIQNCENWVTITDTGGLICIGGIVGTVWIGAEVTLEDCRNCADITAIHSAAGLVGLVNQSTVTITRCCNESRATIKTTGTHATDANNGTAGLVVKNPNSGGTVTINESYNAGTVVGTSNVGGLISYTGSTLKITSSYNTGAIQGNADVGGLIGEVKGGTTTISNSYSSGTITASSGKGGIVGRRSGGTVNYTTAYYLNTTATSIVSNDTSTTNARTKTVMQSQAFATLLGTNFKYVSGNYPQLTWQ